MTNLSILNHHPTKLHRTLRPLTKPSNLFSESDFFLSSIYEGKAPKKNANQSLQSSATISEFAVHDRFSRIPCKLDTSNISTMASSQEGAPTLPGDAIDFAVQSAASQTTEPQAASNGTNDSANMPLRLPSLKPDGDNAASMTASSTPLGMLQNARRPVPTPAVNRGAQLNPTMEARMRAFHLSRQGTPPARPLVGTSASTGSAPDSPGGFAGSGGPPSGLRLPPNMRPPPQNFVSAPVLPKMGGGLSARRGLKLPGGLPGGLPASPVSNGAPAPAESNGNPAQNGKTESLFAKYSEFVDTKNGTLKFAGKATIHGNGIDFSSGSNFSISLDEVDTLEELGKGNYGTVYKVRHARPRIRRPGMGLAGNKISSSSPLSATSEKGSDLESSPKAGATTGVVMAMKEIRLELDEAKFAAIIMELDILHRCLSPYIIDFYGAFFQEGAVYICIEFMDGGSIDKIYGDGIPENVLRKITYATVQGLKTLKDDHNIIHRDVKPTNILVNTKGQVKICDFGVSGNLVASIAKTNIGCQSYMAPERISGGGMSQSGAGGGTYSVQSDIWSLGLSIIECAMGRYPYPPETYNNIFSQLSVSLALCTYWYSPTNLLVGHRGW